jgi:hypothetical protein
MGLSEKAHSFDIAQGVSSPLLPLAKRTWVGLCCSLRSLQITQSLRGPLEASKSAGPPNHGRSGVTGIHHQTPSNPRRTDHLARWSRLAACGRSLSWWGSQAMSCKPTARRDIFYYSACVPDQVANLREPLTFTTFLSTDLFSTFTFVVLAIAQVSGAHTTTTLFPTL